MKTSKTLLNTLSERVRSELEILQDRSAALVHKSAGVSRFLAGVSRFWPREVRVLLDAASADNATIKVGHADAKYGVPYLNATAGGREYGCLGCQPALFADYLRHLQPGTALAPHGDYRSLEARAWRWEVLRCMQYAVVLECRR